MNHRDSRNDDILDALMVVAFLDDDRPRAIPLPDLDADVELSFEDQQALDALGTDLVERIHAGEYEPCRQKSFKQTRNIRRELAGAMNRDDGDGELTDKAREEMEEKIREIEEQDEPKDEPRDRISD